MGLNVERTFVGGWLLQRDKISGISPLEQVGKIHKQFQYAFHLIVDGQIIEFKGPDGKKIYDGLLEELGWSAE